MCGLRKQRNIAHALLQEPHRQLLTASALIHVNLVERIVIVAANRHKRHALFLQKADIQRIVQRPRQNHTIAFVLLNHFFQWLDIILAGFCNQYLIPQRLKEIVSSHNHL